jgi:BMFP domain-containing protein YqiC
VIRYWFFTRARLHRRLDQTRSESATLARRIRDLEAELGRLAGPAAIAGSNVLRLRETNRKLEERVHILQQANLAHDREPQPWASSTTSS